MWGKYFKKIQPMREKIGKKSGLSDMVRLILFVWPSSLTVCEKVLCEKAVKDNLT